jgi:hypothetical protein
VSSTDVAASRRSTFGTSREIKGSDGKRYAFADHNCFACGAANPIGMRLHIELGTGSARTEWVAGRD